MCSEPEQPSTDDGSKNEKFCVDLILVTGDIAERAEIDEYDPPVEFLTLLRKELKESFHKLPEICVIPGNHDVNRAACEKAENKSAADQFKAKFDAYNEFASRFSDELRIDFEKPFVFKRLQRKRDDGQEFRLELVGLNSCMQESHREQDHFGYIGGQQLHQLSTFLKGKKFLPYSIRIAAFHHNPLLQGQATTEAIEALYAASPSADGRNHALNLRNYLHDSRALLTQLAENGFQVALHGHQHVDDVFTIGLPARGYGEPFARSTIVALGAGSAGLRHGTTPQPSIASALLLRFEPIPWGWKMETRRITFAVHGMIHPHVDVEIGDVETLILPRGQPLEAITVVADTLSLDTLSPISDLILPMDMKDKAKDKDKLLRDSKGQFNLAEDFKFLNKENFELWSTGLKREDLQPFEKSVMHLTSLDAEKSIELLEDLIQVLPKAEPKSSMTTELTEARDRLMQGVVKVSLLTKLKSQFNDSDANDLLNDLKLLFPLGLRSWAKDYFYRDEPMLALRELDLTTNKNIPRIKLYVERFSKTAIFNWNLRADILTSHNTCNNKKDCTFWKKWICNEKDPVKLVEKFFFLSWRCAITVIATVRERHEENYTKWTIVVRKRRDSDGSEFDSVTNFVRAACRPSEFKYENFDKPVPVTDSAEALTNAVSKALERETGCSRCEDLLKQLRLIALYLDPLEITPVWLCWLDMDKLAFEKFTANSAHYSEGSNTDALKAESDLEYVMVPLGKPDSEQVDEIVFLCKAIMRAAGATYMSEDTRLALRLWLDWQKDHHL